VVCDPEDAGWFEDFFLDIEQSSHTKYLGSVLNNNPRSCRASTPAKAVTLPTPTTASPNRTQVRGAPLIAIVAALGLSVEAARRLPAGLEASKAAGPHEAADFLLERMEYLRTSRPTVTGSTLTA